MNWLKPLIEKPERLVIGLMSGTSMDGIDTALVKITGDGLITKAELVDFATYPYKSRVRFELGQVSSLTLPRLSDLNFTVGQEFSDAAISLIERAGLKTSEIDLIGSHGQTIFHNPPSRNAEFSSTLQIGEPDVIAERTGITTIGDFRTRDIASSGEGAPLVPYVDFLLFSDPGKVRIAQNIGGISNCTLIPKKLEEIVAFDSGPGNILLDNIMRFHTHEKEHYDKDGMLASDGEVDYKLLYHLLNNDYFKKSPPKTTGSELFGKEEAEKLYKLVENGSMDITNLMSTVAQFTVDTIYNAYEDFIFTDWKIDEVILSGGGAYNPVIFERLKGKLAPIEVEKSDKYGISAESKEAVSFAVLANETLFANCSNLSKVTGALSPSPLGKISIGKNITGK